MPASEVRDMIIKKLSKLIRESRILTLIYLVFGLPVAVSVLIFIVFIESIREAAKAFCNEIKEGAGLFSFEYIADSVKRDVKFVVKGARI